MERRNFLKLAAGAAAFLAARKKLYGFYQSPGLRKFVQPLRGIGTIPVAKADAFAAPVTGVKHYTIDINQYQDQLHPDMGPTTLWGYHPRISLTNPTQAHLGGVIVAQKGVPIQITFQNNLPGTPIIPVDKSASFPDAANLPLNRTAVHLHGGLVPWICDGGPYAWWAPNGTHGESFENNVTLNPTAAGNQAEYFYPNNQSARLMWYHDHAHDITRTNAYAGIASAYIIRDVFEGGLIPLGLPDYIERGGREIPIVIQDKIFIDPYTIDYFDPTWKDTGAPATSGSLWYPHFYDYKKWTMGPTPAGLPPQPTSCIPEMFGDTMLANGSVFPEAAVEPRRYRLRMLNACNARFLNLQMYVDDGSPDSITLNPAGNPTNASGPDFLVIGTEGGFLQTPALVKTNVPFNPLTMKGSLLTAPAERWDIIVDFTAFAGKKIILYNDAPAPFPGGDSANDYYWEGPGDPTNSGPGFGPNTRQILRFAVAVAATGPADVPLKVVPGFNLYPGIDKFLSLPTGAVSSGRLTLPTQTLAGKPVARVRYMTLNEDFDQYGRLIQKLGTEVSPVPGSGTFGRAYDDAATEVVKAGDVEIWQIINLTADTHPMHFHLVDVQVLARQPFDSSTYTGGPVTAYTGLASAPPATEYGYKETVKCHPNQVTTVMMQFNLPTGLPFTQPLSNRPGLGLPAGVACHEYVWHCHILEHEEHDMMRPLVVIP